MERTSRGWRAVAHPVALAAAALMWSVGCVEELDEAPIVAEFVTITPSRGNPTCGDFNPAWEEIRIDVSELAVGDYVTDDGYMTFTVTRVDARTFDWTSDVGVDAVFVKGGPGGMLYQYDPEAFEGLGLSAARGGRSYGISHISICYDVEFARISIGSDATNEVGDPHTFTVNVEQKIGFDGLWTPVADGTAVGVLLEARNGASVGPISDTCAAGGTVNGMCAVTFTSPTPGQVVGHAIASPEIGGSQLVVETDGLDENSDDAIKTFVDAWIGIAPDDLNGIGEAHTFTVQASYDDGTGTPGAVPDGTVIEVTLTPVGAVPAEVVDGCATGTVGGACTVTFVSQSAGTVTGHASMNLMVSGLMLERETDGVGMNSGDAVKTYVAGSLAWNKVDGEGMPFGGTTFEVCRTHAWDTHAASMTALATPECVSVLDDGDGTAGAGPDMDPDDGDFLLTNLYLGRYTVHEAAAPAGFEPDFTTHTIDVVTNSPVGLLTTAYVNTFDAWIRITPDGVNGIGETHTFTVEAQYDDGLGNDVPVPNGTLVAVTLTPTGGAVLASVTDTCATGTAGGFCTVSFTSHSEGVVGGHAAITISDGGPVIHVETDGVAPNSGDATKTFLAGSLRWSKVDGEGAAFGGARFQVCRTHDWVSAGSSMVALGTPACFYVLDDVDGVAGPGPDLDPAPGLFYLDGLLLGRYTVEEAQSLPGFEPSDVMHTIDLTTRESDGVLTTPYVNTLDAWIRISPDGLNGIGEEHTFTVQAVWDDGYGNDVAVPDGTVIVVTLTPTEGMSFTTLANTCATGTVGGTCTVRVVSQMAGTIHAHAAMTLASGPGVFVETDGVAPNSDDAAKQYVAGSLAWYKVDGNGAPFGGTAFEVCRTHAWSTTSGTMELLLTPECVAVADDEDGVAGPGPDMDADTGEFVMRGLYLGRYTVRETVAPPGYALDTNVHTVDLTPWTPIGLVTAPFVNTPEMPTACSPGFWRNHQVFWDEATDPVAIAAGFTTQSSFNAVLGLTEAESPYPDALTMGEAVQLGSGDADKLARHGTAALLNLAAGYPNIYGMDQASLLAAMRNAYLTGVWEPLATELSDANTGECPID